MVKNRSEEAQKNWNLEEDRTTCNRRLEDDRTIFNSRLEVKLKVQLFENKCLLQAYCSGVYPLRIYGVKNQVFRDTRSTAVKNKYLLTPFWFISAE